MPELPEVEAIARVIARAVKGRTIESARAAAVGTLKSFDPPLHAIAGSSITNIARRGKHLVVQFDNELSLLIHLMSAGRLQLFDKPASPRDRTSRLLIRLDDGKELRLREFGTRQSAWAKLVSSHDVDTEETIATLGPEAWPDPGDLFFLDSEPRPLHSLLRDQRTIAGIGRSWVDEILHEARLAPFKKGNTLTANERELLRRTIAGVMDRAIDHYAEVLGLPLPDKLPMPLRIHGKQGQECPVCRTTIEAVFYEDHVMAYCPDCQTGGKKLKDRRLSRLIK